MKEYTISVTKLTDEALMRQACEMTFLGASRQQLLSIYKSEHSPVRTQLFWITANNIPLFIATHLIRHHVGSIPFQLTCREDRHGANPGLINKVDEIIEELSQALIGVKNGDYDFIDEVITSSINQLDWVKSNTDRYTPVNLGLLVNSQSLIDMAKLRLCCQAHKETIQVFQSIKKEVYKVDPNLADMMVRKCIYRGGLCGEPKCCGFNGTTRFKEEMENYSKHFTNLQQGCYIQK